MSKTNKAISKSEATGRLIRRYREHMQHNPLTALVSLAEYIKVNRPSVMSKGLLTDYRKINN